MPTLSLLASSLLAVTVAQPTNPASFTRPPALPLVTHDPYFSTWSISDKLTDSWPRHWTGATTGMCGLVLIDSTPHRFCGLSPQTLPALRQTGVSVAPASTTYHFASPAITLDVEFGSPVLADDVALAACPVSYVRFTATSADNQSHDVRVYLDLSAEWAVNSPEQQVSWSRARLDGIDAVSVGTQAQQVLSRTGDFTRIDWGRLYLAAPRGDGRTDASRADVAVASHEAARRSFAEHGNLPAADDTRMPRSANDDWPVLAATVHLSKVSSQPTSAHLFIAYDDTFSIELFERRLRPLWAFDGTSIGDAIARTQEMMTGDGYKKLKEAESKLVRDAAAIGGDKYAALTALAYRQVMAGHKIAADWDGTPVVFSKENTSNGCIGTVDVIYPACPFFLVYNPALLEAQLKPLMDYSASKRWRFPFAPHDLGTYPKANGQVYGGGERTEENQMPVEESGNMLIMLAALAKVQGNTDFSRPYMPILARWAGFLKEHGLDPTNQLCTDDFAGHLARNINLSAKAVVALGAYAELLKMDGQTAKAAEWRKVAEDFAAKWLTMSRDGNSTMLVFEKPGTWSQKYNLVWDRVLGLNLFPAETFSREVAFYKTKLNKFGLPLDSRRGYTKLDWTVWSASLTGSRADLDAIMTPVYTWVSEGPSRVPLTDWYETENGETRGMYTRTVVGGIWMPMLMKKMNAGF
jgi:hypothetical protein